jgi:hypothetical protein
MSKRDVEAIRRLLGAFNRGDFSALAELDPHAELQDEPRIPGASSHYGHAGAVRWAVKLWQRLAGSGIEVDMGGYCVFAMRAARVTPVEFFETMDAALAAVNKRRSR